MHLISTSLSHMSYTEFQRVLTCWIRHSGWPVTTDHCRRRSSSVPASCLIKSSPTCCMKSVNQATGSCLALRYCSIAHTINAHSSGHASSCCLAIVAILSCFFYSVYQNCSAVCSTIWVHCMRLLWQEQQTFVNVNKNCYPLFTHFFMYWRHWS